MKSYEKEQPMASMPNVCPYCKEEYCLDHDYSSLKFISGYLHIPVTCGVCGKNSETIYSIEFEQTEGREE